jgi:hypothetical protein
MESKHEVQKIIHLQILQITCQMHLLTIKSHNPTINVPERLEVPTQNLPNLNKRGRSSVTKDTQTASTKIKEGYFQSVKCKSTSS